MKRIASAVLIALLTVQPAHSLSMSLGVEGGLDRKTRKFLERYPEKVRKEFIKALEQALPLVDRGVDRALDRVDESVSKAASEARCLVAMAPPAAGSAADRILKNILNKPTGNTLTSDLLEFAEDRREKIESEMETDDAFARYTDVVGTVWELKCYFKDNEAVTKSINSLSADYHRSHLTWQYIEALECPTVGACYKQIATDTSELVREADPRDVAGANAKSRLAALPGPDAKVLKGGFKKPPKPKKGQMTLKTFETSVSELRTIQGDIALQGLKRAEAADKLLDESEVALVRAAHAYANLSAALKTNSSATLTAAFMGKGRGVGPAARLQAELAAIDIDAALATSTAEPIETRAASLTKRRAELITRLDGVLKSYPARLKVLQQQEAAEAARQARADRCCAEIH